jgi:hypothetical protein
MKVQNISVNIRYSADTGAGAWKTIELGTEATLSSSGEDWEQAQRELYARLSEQLKLVWSGKADAGYTPEGSRIDAQPAKAHWCAETAGIQGQGRQIRHVLFAPAGQWLVQREGRAIVNERADNYGINVLTGDWVRIPTPCSIDGTTRTEIEVHGDKIILICPCCKGTGEHPWGVNSYYCNACSYGKAKMHHCVLPHLAEFHRFKMGWPLQN